MNQSILFMLKLIASVIGGTPKPAALPEVDWVRIFEVSAAHDMTNIVSYGIVTGDYEINADIKALFIKAMYEALARSENQSHEMNKIFEAFEREKISYMPLKGTVLRDIYPSADMRIMSDADILVKSQDYDKFNRIMCELGYEFDVESNHEYNYIKKPLMHVELHKRMIPSYNEDLYSYYGDGWKLAKSCGEETSRFELSPEDNYIYVLAHFAKHYRDAGAGIKHLTDLWLCGKKYNMDEDYIVKQLEKVGLLKFYKNTEKLISYWFEDGEPDDVICAMSEFIISSGSHGTIKNRVAAETIRGYKDTSKAKKYRYIRMIFPMLSYMKNVYPILEKAPYLLPLCWILRLLRGALFRRKNISRHMAKAKSFDSGFMNEYEVHMKSVGLDIYNGRKLK